MGAVRGVADTEEAPLVGKHSERRPGVPGGRPGGVVGGLRWERPDTIRHYENSVAAFTRR